MVAARPAQAETYVEFREALLEFSDAPSAGNLVRYLAASRALGRLEPTARRRPEARDGELAEGWLDLLCSAAAWPAHAGPLARRQ
jgi:hypothetical protein